jgi:hypothetical protein
LQYTAYNEYKTILSKNITLARHKAAGRLGNTFFRCAHRDIHVVVQQVRVRNVAGGVTPGTLLALHCLVIEGSVRCP